MIRTLRYYLTRIFLWILGLRVAKWSRYVEYFWNSDDQKQENIVEEMFLSYKPLNADGVPVLSIDDLNASPVLTKRKYREVNSKHPEANVFIRKTSGTTGEPTTVKLSRVDLSRMLGVRDYCFRHYGVRLGDREARFWGRSELGIKANVKNFILNRKVCFPMGENAGVSVARILKWKPDYLYGYASLLLEAAALIEKNRLKFTPPKCVICTAETIMPAQKKYLAAVFHAPVVEEYGATEFDIVAFECRDGHRHFVNPWLLVREQSGSILISDVGRTSGGLLNYDIGDSGTTVNSGCSLLGSTRSLAVLEGRSIHRFVYIDSKTRFHSVDLAHAINEFQIEEGEVFNFRIVQTEYGIIDLYVSALPSRGVERLKYNIEKSIKLKTGYNIVAKVYAGENNIKKNQKSYFIQNISEPESCVESI